jgi:required for meiotic nuclear division protein 1
MVERIRPKSYQSLVEDEYELKERANLLTRKLTVISNTGQVLANIIDTDRSLRLEIMIVALILLEIMTGSRD